MTPPALIMQFQLLGLSVALVFFALYLVYRDDKKHGKIDYTTWIALAAGGLMLVMTLWNILAPVVFR